jgi:heat shock protein HtpX
LMICLAEAGAKEWYNSWIGERTFPAAGRFATFALALAAYEGKTPRFLVSGDRVLIDMHLPTLQVGMTLSCRISTSTRNFSSLQRHIHRAGNHRHSRRVIAGMVLLLALCGWMTGGEEGARLALNGGTSAPESPIISPEMMARQYGARQLHSTDVPALFTMLRDICGRAHLPRLPDLYYLADPNSMNAYALGGPEGSAITLTEGLLRGMTPNEIAGILAHEVAHIRNDDLRSMTWATALNRAIVLTSFIALISPRVHAQPIAKEGKLVSMLLTSASAISHLLYLTLSRIRELDADAAALELIDDPRALVAALHKLERHHTGSHAMTVPPDGLARFLRSHPPTWERVGILAGLSR